MSIAVASQREFAKDMFNYILSKMSGTHPDDDLTTARRPSEVYIVGTLASKKENEKESDKEIVVEQSLEEEEGRASVRTRRLRVSILIRGDTLRNESAISVKFTGHLYYRRNASVNIQEGSKNASDKSRPKVWKRLPFSKEVMFNQNGLSEGRKKNVDFSEELDLANADDARTDDVSPYDWSAEISIERELFDPKANLYLVSIYLTNIASEPVKAKKQGKKDKVKDKKRIIERTLFNCQLDVRIDNITVDEFVDEYEYEGHKQKYFYDFRCSNCQAFWTRLKTNFSTRHFAEYYQDNIQPRQSIDNLELSFEDLSSEPNISIKLQKFLESLKQMKARYRSILANNDMEDFQIRVKDKQRAWSEIRVLVDLFDDLCLRIEEGTNLILNDAKVKGSFMKMNQAFGSYYRNKGISNGKWRLFQAAFVLATIPSITQKKYLDIADILHVNTGGGKSEAYFALVIFSAFYERSQGKSDGVTAIVKFPLRMLSIQQLERIASIVIHAEIVRKSTESTYPGSEFSIGYYVGDSDDFPQYYSAIRKRLYDGKLPVSPAPISLIISKCPLCDIKERGNVRLKDDSNCRRIIHECDKCHNRFLIYCSAREIYRWRPTIIVSTVDKWASLAQQRRGRSLLGGSGSLCHEGHGFIPSGDFCENDRKEEFECKNIGENNKAASGPLLSIQDEMHLLNEGFGTISGHFEGLLESIVEYTSGHKLKHITMSATLNGAHHQAKELYNKNSFIIPGRCPDDIGGESDFFFVKQQDQKRIIYGLKPNLRDNHYASLRSVLHAAEFLLSSSLNVLNDPQQFCLKYHVDIKGAKDLIKQFIVPLTFHIKKQDAYDMGKLQLDVITPELSKKFGATCNGITLTGDGELEDLKNAMNSIKEYVANFDLPNAETQFQLQPIYSTSVISHGVDLDELNFMIFQGLPYSTSEYIQALSRVGRKSLGLILLWFYPNRVRDNSFFTNFSRYHETIDHQVKPIPIKRLSKLGILQTINSIFCAGVINYLSNKKGEALIHKKELMEINSHDKQDLIDFITKCYTGTERGGRIDIDLAREVEDRLNYIRRSRDKDTEFFPNILTNSGEYFFRNQTGMRGIQKKLILELEYSEQSKLKR